jgi:putative tryptophan/tyrosine transport system substrate-binding protein
MKTIFLSILFVTVLLVVADIAEAQPPKKVPRIGYLAGASHAAIAFRLEAFRQGLRELGYLEGKNIGIEYRYSEGNFRRQKELAFELAVPTSMLSSGPLRPVPPRKPPLPSRLS